MKPTLTLFAALLLAPLAALAIEAPWNGVHLRVEGQSLTGFEPRLGRADGPVLKWQAQAGQRLEFTPAPVDGATGCDVSICYEEKRPDLVKLAIIAEDGTELYRFDLFPDDSGWRRLYADLATDALVVSDKVRKRPVRMVLSWVGAGTLTLYLAQPRWVKSIAFRRTPDTYCPSIYARRTDSYAADMRQWLEAVTNRPPASVPASTAKSDMVYRRYLEWVLGRGTNTGVFGTAINRVQDGWMADARQKVRRFGLHRDGGWIVPAQGQHPTQDEMKDVLTPLAMAYRRAPEAALLDDILLLFDALHQSGFAVCNPADPTADFMGFTRLRLAGYANAVGLLRDELTRTGRIARERRTLRWHALAAEWDGNRRFEANADSFRGEALPRLIYALTATNENWRARELSCFRGWLTENLAVQSNLQGFIKPDMTFNHHRNPYLVAYGPNALLAAANCATILEGSAWSLDSAVKERLETCAETLLILSRGFTLPLGARGRFPDAPRAMTENIPLFITLAQPDIFSGRLAAPARRLTEAAGLQTTAGALGNLSIKQKLGWQFSAGIAALADAALKAPPAFAEHPGFFSYNWAGLATTRQPGWQATVQGFSKWLYDFETGNPPTMDNDWGRYIRYGTLELWSGTDPFDEPSSGMTLRQGWDWSLMPGATVIRLPPKDLGLPAPPGKRPHRNFSDRKFCASLAGPEAFGAFGLDLHDSTFAGHLEARKSVIFAGDQLICLGSRIRATRRDAPVVTPLFQFGKAGTASPDGDTSGTLAPGVPVTFTDPAGNQFRLLAGKQWERHVGKQSNPAVNGKITQGHYDSVWINHGVAPQNQNYTYVILPNVGARAAQLPPWRVATCSDAAHVVVFPQEHSTAHILFEATDKPVGDLLRCDRPCLVWVTGAGSAQVTLRVCDPDLNCPGGTDAASP
ncbi:MAG: chondroitinase family polysaccharide lyase, partial [Kiritimatiellaeota bacterium]|nr:chondroitinase family polysaccharide lyase [Kiritimatiellota bacterium]